MPRFLSPARRPLGSLFPSRPAETRFREARRCKTSGFRQDSSMFHPFIAFLAPGGGEMLVVMLALLLLFGPKDAPRILRRSLEVLRKVQQSANRFKNDLLSASLDPDVQARARDTSVYDQEKSAPPPTPPTPQSGETPP